MKRNHMRLMSLLLALMVLCSAVPAASAADSAQAGAITVSVSFYDGANTQFLSGREQETLAPGLAASYGYTSAALTKHAGEVTVFDALVQAHVRLLGEAFTPEMKDDFLSLSSSGMLTKVMGEGGAYGPPFGFMVNGRTPNDGVYNEVFGSYTGYTADDAVLRDGDVVELFFYQDQSFWGDTYTWFDKTEATVQAGAPLELTLSGYMAMFGVYTEQVIASSTEPVAEVEIVRGTSAETLSSTGLTTDENGKVTLTFDTPGTYIVSAIGEEYAELVAPWCVVTVKAPGVRASLRAQAAGAFLLPEQTGEIPAGLAAKYGYQNAASVTGVSALDALVRAHELLFGEMFTPETAGELLAVNNGSVSRVFGEDTANFGFTVNGVQPHGDTWTEGGGGYPGYYNAYAVHETALSDGDAVEFFLYQDSYGLDLYSWFEQTGEKVTALTVKEGEQTTLTLSGYSIGWYGASDEATIESRTEAVADAQLAFVDEYGNITDITGKFTDENGEATLTFDTPGNYALTAYVTEEDITEYYATPILMPWLSVTVQEQSEAEKAATDLALLYEAFYGTYTAAKPLEFPYGTGEGQFTNALAFIKSKAAELLPHRTADEITVEANMTTLPGTVGAGTAIEAKTMDAMGNITPVYSEAATKPALMSVYFGIGAQKSDKINTIYLSVAPLAADAQKRTELEASAITWDSIRGKNTSPDSVTQSIGKLSGSAVGALPNTPAIFKNGVSITWSLTHTAGTAGALALDSSRKTAVLRPNVGEADGKYRLTATVADKAAPEAVKTVDFDLTVPAFLPAVAEFVVSPADLTLAVTDNYYKEAVDGTYITMEEGGARRHYTLHAGATGAAQSYAYTASREGYITKSGSISISGDRAEPIEIALTASSEQDTKLQSLDVTSPAPGAASIKAPMEAFNPDTAAYTMTVGALDSITLAPSAFVGEAKVTVTRHSSTANANKGTTADSTVAAGKTAVCYLRTDGTPTVITVTVTAPEGSTQEVTTRRYTLTVTRTNEEHTLKAIAVSAKSTDEGGKNGRAVPPEEILTPTLDKGGLADRYTCYVNHYCTSVQIKPTAVKASDIKEIRVNGTAVASGKNSDDIALAYGNNQIKIEVTKNDGIQETYHLIVRRKQDAILSGFAVTGGIVTAPVSKWTASANFAYSAQTVTLAFDAPEGSTITVEGVEGTYAPGEPVLIPVGDEKTRMITVSVRKEFEEDGQTYTDHHAYVIGLYRMAADAPSAVEAYLPAPGQFVNQDAYQNPEKTLAGTSGGMVTLGSFGGSIVYRFDEPIKNDEKNPYGVDFIVFGNAFTNADGTSSASAAEPGAVMVSKDGQTWYELAGSMYYDANTRHNISVTYENPDPAFSGAADISWTDSEGNTGVLAKNAFHTQPYYPNPAYYGSYNTGIGKNETYTAQTMTVAGGTVFGSAHSPAYGYADTHAAASTVSNLAVNPYRENHYKAANGDGMDLSWAVDENGNPVALDEISYVKIYNPTLYVGGTGELSPEITGILRAQASDTAVGKTQDLTALSMNGKEIALKPGVYTYSFDSEGAAALTVGADCGEAANIYVGDTYIPSGSVTPAFLAGDKVRVVAQAGEKEPVIYTITIEGAGASAANADLSSVTVIPGDIAARSDGDAGFRATVPYETSSIRICAVPLNAKASVQVQEESLSADSGWVGTQSISLTAGKTLDIPVTVISQDKTIVKQYTVSVTRKASGGGSGGTETDTISVRFSLIGDSKHAAAAHTKFETWLAPKTYQIPKGSKVKYLTDKVLIEAGIPFKTDAKGTYITEINGLGELDNGPLSGWMYTINGTHKDINGYASQTLFDNDVIVWHYSDDYTKEDGSIDDDGGKGNGGSGTAQTDDTASVVSGSTVSPKVTAKNNAASVTVASKYITAALKNTASGGQLTIAPKITGAADSVSVTLTAKDAASVAAKAGSLAVKTEFAVAVLPKQSLAAINSGDVTVILSKNTDGTVTASLTCGGKAVERLSGGMRIALPAPQETVPVAVLAGGDKILTKSAFIDGMLWILADGPVTIKLTENEKLYTDVSGHWGAADVAFVSGRGLFLGVDDTRFDPDGAMTRAMLTTVLYRLEGEPDGAAGKRFDDVAADAWYARAVAWAAEEQIVLGTDNGFDPEGTITREQLAAMLCRYAAYLGLDTSARGGLDGFSDAAAASEWARRPLGWCVENGILTGKGGGILDAGGSTTRAEVAAMLCRFMKLLLK